MVKIGVILNLSARKASKIDTDEIIAIIKRELPDAKIYTIKESFERTVQKAIRDGCKVLCAGGGDGTVSGIAARCVKKNLVLGVLPLGTMNNFSKDLGIPQDVTKACKIIARFKINKVDYATVNNELFLNNSSVGAYARYVIEREGQQKAHGKISAYFTSLIATVDKIGLLDVRLQYNNNSQSVKTPIIFISNNDYNINEKHFIRRKTLSSGELNVHILTLPKDNIMLNTLKHIITPNKTPIRYKSFHTKKLIIDTPNSKISIAKDGEIISTKLPLTYKIHSKKLSVIVP